jgi:hypothetical protein
VVGVALGVLAGSGRPAPAGGPGPEDPALLAGLQGDYLGQPPPGATPRLFAPGVVSTGLFDRDIAVTPGGDEIYFGVAGPGYSWATILFTRRVAGGRWTRPERAPFTAPLPATDLEPALSPDGRRLFFLSDRPRTAGEPHGNSDIWFVERSGTGWGEPQNLGSPVSSPDQEYFPSVTRDGSLYFTRQRKGERGNLIYRSALVEGRYAEPERLPSPVNAGPTQFNAFVAPDESYLIFSSPGRKDAIGQSDYYVCFRSRDGTWSDAVNLGPRVNVKGSDGYSPYVSPDGRYFFFMSRRRGALEARAGRPLTPADILELHGVPENGNADTYWMDAAFLAALRPGE